MKKIFFIILTFLFLTGCNNPKNKESDYEILQKVADNINFDEEVSSNLELKSSFQYNNLTIYAEWISEDQEILSNDGQIFQSSEEYLITLTVNLSLNDETLQKTFDLIILPLDSESYANKILDLINIPSEIDNHISLDNFIKYEGVYYKISWKSSNEEVMDSRGKIVYSLDSRNITLSATINYDGSIYTKNFPIRVKPFDTSDMINYLNDLNIPTELENSLNLTSKVTINGKDYTLEWKSSNENVLDNNGNLGICLNDENISLSVLISIDEVSIEKTFSISIKQTSPENIIDMISSEITVPSVISDNIFLPTNINNLIKGTWTSGDESIISSAGIVNKTIEDPLNTTLTFNFTIGEQTMAINYNVNIYPVKHFIMDSVFDGNKENLVLNDKGQLILENNKLEGTYYSNEIECHTFSEVVATWCAISSKTSTCELFVSLKVNGTYSDYITYGEWGLGLQNGSTDQTNSLIKLADDEVKVLNNKYANAIKYKIILKRKSVNNDSPIVSLITFALNLTNYNYDFSSELLKKSVKYDVPELYQHDVPTIGNSICSITSSTMLLKYKGYSFKEFNALEHEYMASLLRDYGNNIYGNWVFNCVGMSAFGERAYVKRFFNTNEFLYSIQEIGPMAASIKGTVKYFNMKTQSNGSYTSAGHLLVVTGYEITESVTYIFINDPNVNGVSIRMTLPDFLNIWRNVSYIIE